MPIELRTGLPGAGKSLGAVEELLRLRKVSPERPRYCHGITDLREGLAIPLDEEGVRNWAKLPAGSIIVVDECQRLMPARRGAGDTAQWIRDLSTHRHLGLDFILITQHPSLCDAYVRRLVDRHIHTVRMYGTHMVERYQWPLCEADPNSKSSRKMCDSKTRHTYSKEAMASYTSAELHTVKRQIPKFLKVAAVVALLLPVLAFAGYKVMASASKKPAGASGASSSFGPQAETAAASKHVLTPAEWIKQQVPRVAGVPWSAPIFDGAKVQAQPELYCATYGGEKGDESCLCHTEQATKAAVPDAMCRAYAKGGVYNPYRPAFSDRVSGAQPVQQGTGGAAVPQERQTGPAMSTADARYPSRGVGEQAYTPPEAMPWNPEGAFTSSRR